MERKYGALIGVRKAQTPFNKPGIPEQILPPENVNWRMDDNNKFGDCTIAAVDHVTAAWNMKYNLTLPRLSDPELLHDYFHLTGGTDTGLAPQTVMSAWEHTRIFGYAIKNASSVTPQSLKSAIADSGVAYLAVSLPDTAEQQFAAGLPWRVVSGASIVGGHAIVGVGYDPDFVYIVTWGKIQKVTYNWLDTYLAETWFLTL